MEAVGQKVCAVGLSALFDEAAARVDERYEVFACRVGLDHAVRHVDIVIVRRVAGHFVDEDKVNMSAR